MGHTQELRLHLSPELIQRLNLIARHKGLSLEQLAVSTLVTAAEECAFEASHSFSHRLDQIEARLTALEQGLVSS